MISIRIDRRKKLNGLDEQAAFIAFDFDMELVNIFRSELNRAWHADEKLWEVPLNRIPVLLQSFGTREIVITGTVAAKVQKQLPVDFNFKTSPFKHQVEGFEYGMQNNSFLLADEQGLGKTKQVIDIAVAKKQSEGYKHCLIVCGVNGLKWNWKAEIETHSNETAFVLGTIDGKFVGTSEAKLQNLNNLPNDYFIITNVESLRYAVKGTKKTRSGKIEKIYPITAKLQQLIKNEQIDMVAIDEIHKCKNPDNQQGKAILELQSKTRIAMTGTPLMNQPLDLFIILKWLGFENHSFYQFKGHYTIKGDFNAIVGYKNLDQLQQNLDSIMLRRLKKDVLDLPSKLHTTEFVEMGNEQAKIYKEVEAAVKAEIDLIKLDPNPLSRLIRLRQATAYTGILSSTVQQSAKFDRLEELVEEAVANGDKVIVFSNWVDVINPATKRLAAYNPAVITGETKNREIEKSRFMQDNDCKVILGTIGAMGTGLTLTAGSTVIFLDSPWNRANKEQAEDRAHRIGTKSNVNVITLVCKGTIDERIEDIVASKGEMADLLVDKVAKQSRGKLVDYLLGI